MAWETLLSLGHEVEFIWSYVSMARTQCPSMVLRRSYRARRTSPTKYPFLILRSYCLVVLLYVAASSYFRGGSSSSCSILQASVTGLGFDTHFFRPPHCYAWFTFQAISLQVRIV
jgi:hypothetical protein